MTEDEFWVRIDRANAGPRTKSRDEHLQQQVQSLETDELGAFITHFDRLLWRAYTHSLWGAAAVVFSDVSDDLFWDFRTGLIASGRHVFEAVLRDPQALADFDDATIEALLAEGYQYVADREYQRRTGRSMPVEHGGVPLAALQGEKICQDWEDLVREYPRLVARFG